MEFPLSNYPTYSYFGHLAKALGLRYWVVPELQTHYWANVTLDEAKLDAVSRVLSTIVRLRRSQGER